jgi:hypothetical protein
MEIIDFDPQKTVFGLRRRKNKIQSKFNLNLVAGIVFDNRMNFI